jgi:hypothetical protein
VIVGCVKVRWKINWGTNRLKRRGVSAPNGGIAAQCRSPTTRQSSLLRRGQFPVIEIGIPCYSFSEIRTQPMGTGRFQGITVCKLGLKCANFPANAQRTGNLQGDEFAPNCVHHHTPVPSCSSRIMLTRLPLSRLRERKARTNMEREQ